MIIYCCIWYAEARLNSSNEERCYVKASMIFFAIITSNREREEEEYERVCEVQRKFINTP